MTVAWGSSNAVGTTATVSYQISSIASTSQHWAYLDRYEDEHPLIYYAMFPSALCIYRVYTPAERGQKVDTSTSNLNLKTRHTSSDISEASFDFLPWIMSTRGDCIINNHISSIKKVKGNEHKRTYKKKDQIAIHLFSSLSNHQLPPITTS